jgi:HlyD family secretion protein
MLDVPQHQKNETWTERRVNWLRSLKISRPWEKSLGAATSYLLWRWRYRAPALLVALAVLWYFGALVLFGPVINVDAVVRADFVQSVVASGHVEAPFRVNIGSQITGVVASIPVDEGQSVKAGDTLIVLDDREARAAVVQAEATLARDQASLEKANRDAERLAALFAKGSAAKVTLDDARTNVDMLTATVKQDAASLVTAQSRLSYTVIVAPRDGRLISRDVERGNIVQPSNVLMKLSPVGDTQLVVQIDEKNLGMIKIGQKALASADAFSKETFAAEVVYINPGIDLQRASVEVKLRVPEPPAYLSQDMTVSVDIEVAKRPNTLLVPVASLRGMTNDKPWVMKANGWHARRQPVKVGLISVGKAEILDGLREGDLVLPATATIKDGARIRARVVSAPAP